MKGRLPSNGSRAPTAFPRSVRRQPKVPSCSSTRGYQWVNWDCVDLQRGGRKVPSLWIAMEAVQIFGLQEIASKRQQERQYPQGSGFVFCCGLRSKPPWGLEHLELKAKTWPYIQQEAVAYIADAAPSPASWHPGTSPTAAPVVHPNLRGMRRMRPTCQQVKTRHSTETVTWQGMLVFEKKSSSCIASNIFNKLYLKSWSAISIVSAHVRGVKPIYFQSAQSEFVVYYFHFCR